MGCCMSTKPKCNSTNVDFESESLQQHPYNKFNDENRAPPPCPQKETIVKEVVEETSTPISESLLKSSNPILDSPLQDQTTQKVPVFDVKAQGFCKNSTTSSVDDVSIMTATIQFEDLQANLVNSGPPPPCSRNWADLRLGKSPSRKSDRSPVRRNQGMERQVRSKTEFDWSDHQGERSGRRSPKSPVTNRSVSMGGSQSFKRSSNQDSLVEESYGNNMESLENPLVSLECFIFL